MYTGSQWELPDTRHGTAFCDGFIGNLGLLHVVLESRVQASMGYDEIDASAWN